MKTAIILHGLPDKEEYFNSQRASQSNSHWLPWIQQQLIVEGVLAQTPEMPVPYAPEYEQWSAMFEQFSINEDTTLVGHSCGGGFLVRWLSENKIKVGKVVLVAPWLDPERERTGSFFDFVIDEDVAERTKGLHLLVSTDDYPDILESVSRLKSKIRGLQIKEFSDKGHFTLGDMGTDKFPELKEVLLSDQ